MGIQLAEAKHLLELAQSGVSFRKTLTLGRQQIFFNPHDLVDSLKNAGKTTDKIRSFLDRSIDAGPADAFLEILGAEEVTALDASDYQGAALRHDLNTPAPPHLHASFDLVLDGGTLEHVFNFPVAVRNAMEMVKEGGMLVILTPGNNQLGHGFYQFSPELFYNILSEANGYSIDRMLALELSPCHRSYSVANPAVTKSRVTLSNSWPVLLFVAAKRVKKTELFKQTPQQTDYVSLWGEKSGKLADESSNRRIGAPSKTRKLKNLALSLAPGLLWFFTTFKRVFLSRETEFRNRNFYRDPKN